MHAVVPCRQHAAGGGAPSCNWSCAGERKTKEMTQMREKKNGLGVLLSKLTEIWMKSNTVVFLVTVASFSAIKKSHHLFNGILRK